MKNKTKLRTVREDKWERKEYIATCDSDLVKDRNQTTYPGTEKELSKRRRGHKMSHMQLNITHNRTSTTLSNSRNSIQTDNTLNQWTEVVKLY